MSENPPGEGPPIDEHKSSETDELYIEQSQLAEQYFLENAQARIDFLQQELGDKVEVEKLRSYLLDSVPSSQDFSPEAVREIAYYNSLKGVQIDETDEAAEVYESFLSPRFDEMEDTAMNVGITPAGFRDCVSELRTDALLLEHTAGQDAVSFMRREFVENKAIMLVRVDQPIPPRLELLIEGERLKKIRERNEIAKANRRPIRGGSGVQFLAQLNDQNLEENLKAGMHPAFAEKEARKVTAKTAKFMAGADVVRNRQIQEFLAKHPDPRVIIDQILDAKDGKLPL